MYFIFQKLKKILFLCAFSISCISFSALAQNASEINPDLFDDSFFEDDFSFETAKKSKPISDPLESINRKMFVFNDYVDRYFLEHVAKSYRKFVPRTARNIIGNFLTNISLPFSIINSIFQGKVENSLANSSTFLINTTIGIGGLFDVAGNKGIRYNKEDFGQTLGRYGLPSGPYLMLPFMGPSNFRDLSGSLVDRSISPFDFNLLEIGNESDILDSRTRISLTAASVIDAREELIEVFEGIRSDSFDQYTTVKSAYFQRRENEISK